MSSCLMSIVSADAYMHYIPFYLYVAEKMDVRYGIRIYVQGELDRITFNALAVLRRRGLNKEQYPIVMNSFLDYPEAISATNILRFLVHDAALDEYQYILITDIDLLLLKSPLPLYEAQMVVSGSPYAGQHGPLHKPHRPEITSSWTGNFERVAGGYFCVTPEWYKKTEKAREKYNALLKQGDLGQYRECDEVILARIIKESGMSVPSQRNLPIDFRGIHLGDFRENMFHRWKDMAKMKTRISDTSCRKFLEFEKETAWKELLAALSEDRELMQVFDNVRIHVGERRIAS